MGLERSSALHTTITSIMLHTVQRTHSHHHQQHGSHYSSDCKSHRLLKSSQSFLQDPSLPALPPKNLVWALLERTNEAIHSLDLLRDLSLCTERNASRVFVSLRHDPLPWQFARSHAIFTQGSKQCDLLNSERLSCTFEGAFGKTTVATEVTETATALIFLRGT